MKRLFILMLAVGLLLSMAACSSSSETASADAEGKKVLLVRAREGGGENPLIDHLKKLGYTVYDVVDANLSMDQAKDYDVIYVSDAVSSSRIGTRLKQSPIPVVMSKTQTAGVIGMAGVTNYGEADGLKSIQIEDNKHPLAAGLKGEVAVYKDNGKISYVQGLGKDAKIIAQVESGGQKSAVIYAYEKGAKDASGETVQARQVFFSLPGGHVPNLTDEGWKLFDAAIAWAAQNGKK
ncbi:hypothetical protein [Paenibacillus sp. y28]|uniref:hypothetical protein n=1 Tax=Paenibacillus sp. y28 TaxID=3129110 RepID=UPI003018DD25